MTATYDVVGIGNALVDVLAPVDDAFLVEHGLVKGSMALVDAGTGRALYEAMGPAVEVSGGSAANTMAGLASLGSRVAFVGRVAGDQLGEVFTHDIRAAGVAFDPRPAGGGSSPTGRSLIVVSGDGQRTMSTLLGASSELGPDDVDEALVAGARITYLEGYLFDRPPAREAFDKAAAAAHRAGRQVAVSLSDSFCVERFRDEFRALVDSQADILFANEDELRLLSGHDDFGEALASVEELCPLVVATRGAAGSTVVAGGTRFEVAAAPVHRVVDTTGAGDLYAAGFLHGLSAGLDPPSCGRLGALAAAEVIGHLGARPERSLADLADLADLAAGGGTAGGGHRQP
ncbi:MAG TPA: adenosine kinase [Acidimicrobiales bacterium]|nr:adenosine kinase [Acidimicrobiales bacterium]